MAAQVNLELFSAARSGNLQIIQDYFRDDEAIVKDAKTPEGNTVLQLAARFGHRDLVDELIRRCPSLVYQRNFKGETPLHVAAKAGRDKVVEVLINQTAQAGRDEVVEVLIDQTDTTGLRIGWSGDNSGNTPLHGAVRNGHSKVVNEFAGRDLRSLLWVNDAGESPLLIAINMRFSKLAATIIDLNKSTLDYCGNDNQTPLHCAVMRQDFGIMEKIMNLKEDLVGKQDGSGMTPLHHAAALGHQKMVEALIKKNPLVAYQGDNNRKIPLHLAAVNGQKHLIGALLGPCPETIETVDMRQQNVLHVAAKNGNVGAVSYILKLPEMEDLVNSPDEDGNTPLHLAARNYHNDVVSVLSKNSKVEIRAVNKKNQTAIAIVKLPVDRSMELQKHLTLKELKNAYKRKAIHFADAAELDHGEVGKGEKPNKDALNDKAERIFVMSTLIATFTFSAVFQIPGGFRSDDPDGGLAMLISKSAFRAFVISDAIAMTSSITAAVIVFWSFSRRDTESFLDTLPLTIVLTWTSLIAMALAFVTGLFVVLQKTLWLAILVCVIGCAPLFILFICPPIFVTVLEMLSMSQTSLSNLKNMVEDNPFLFIFRSMKIFVQTRRYFLRAYLSSGGRGQVN